MRRWFVVVLRELGSYQESGIANSKATSSGWKDPNCPNSKLGVVIWLTCNSCLPIWLALVKIVEERSWGDFQLWRGDGITICVMFYCQFVYLVLVILFFFPFVIIYCICVSIVFLCNDNWSFLCCFQFLWIIGENSDVVANGEGV